MLRLYRGSGSAEIELIKQVASFEAWSPIRAAAVHLLRERQYGRASDVLANTRFEVWEGTNSFADDFQLLYLPVSLDGYARYERIDATDRIAYRFMAEAVSEVSDYYIRFIAVGIQKATAINAPQQPATVTAAPDDVGMPARFDVAISFAGPQRDLAEKLAVALRDRRLAVFYDNFYTEDLWGKDLAAFFDDVFRKRARYCVMFISKAYASRVWTTHERRSALARAMNELEREYILPIRVDDTELPGLPPLIGYLSLAQYSIDQIATILIRKLSRG